MKYTSKNVSWSENKSNEYYVFSALNFRAFTYSSRVLPSVTAYQKVRYLLIQRKDKLRKVHYEKR
jgi:hypothetical protein